MEVRHEKRRRVEEPDGESILTEQDYEEDPEGYVETQERIIDAIENEVELALDQQVAQDEEDARDEEHEFILDTIRKKYKLAADPFNDKPQLEVLNWGVAKLIRFYGKIAWKDLPYSPRNIDLLKDYSPSIIMMTAVDSSNLLVSRYFQGVDLKMNVKELSEIACHNGRVIFQFPKETLSASLFVLMKANPDVQNIPEVETFFGYR